MAYLCLKNNTDRHNPIMGKIAIIIDTTIIVDQFTLEFQEEKLFDSITSHFMYYV